VLEYVVNEHLGNAIVAASIRHWTRQSVEAALEAGGADALLDEFRRGTQRVRRDRSVLSIAKPAVPQAGSAARIEPVPGATPSFSLLQGCVHQLTQQPEALLSVEVPLTLNSEDSCQARLMTPATADAEPSLSARTTPTVAATAAATTAAAAAAVAASTLSAMSAAASDGTVSPSPLPVVTESPVSPRLPLDSTPDALLSSNADTHGSSTDSSQEEEEGEDEDDENEEEEEEEESRTGDEYTVTAAIAKPSHNARYPRMQMREEKKKCVSLGKRRRDPADATEPAPASESVAEKPSAIPLPTLPAIANIPVLLLRLGVREWRKHRQRQPTEAQHLLDDAMAEVMWQLADTLPEGLLLQVPEFKRARRSESRKVAAAFSHRMAGERQCDLILRLLDQMDKEEAEATRL